MDPEQLNAWAAAVELDRGAGVRSDVGGFGVVLESDREVRHAEATRARLDALGHGAVVERVRVSGTLYHRVVVRGFAAEADAAAYAARMGRGDGALAPGAFTVSPTR